MTKNRRLFWFALAALAPAVLVAAIGGLWAYMSVTATPIHSNPHDVRSVSASPPDAKWAEAIGRGQEIVRTGITDKNLPGVSVAVGVGDDVVWAEGFGWADLENRVQVTPQTRFRIGTASKMLTSAAVGLLIEDGRLRLDDVIQTYVSEWPGKPWPITLRQVMSHQSGIRPDEGDEEPLQAHCDGTVDGIQRFAGSQLLFEPGTRYRYSSYNWILVSAAVESAGQQRFSSFMRQRVFEPLALSDTRADASPEAVPGQAVFYFPRFAADPHYGPQSPERVDYSCFSGSSAFVSTPADLLRFVTAFNAGKLLKPSTVKVLQTSQRLASGQDTGYGLGWDLETMDLAGAEAATIGYDGELKGGVVISVLSVPAADLTVAVFSNISYADTPTLAQKIARLFVR